MIDFTPEVDTILATIPELRSSYQEHLSDNDGELLAYVYLPEVLRQLDRLWVKRSITEVDLRELAKVIERQLANGAPATRNLIGLAFLEHLDYSKVGPIIEQYLGPVARALLKESRDWLPRASL